MDTSISKALIMVASVLLAMIVIAFLTFTFNRTGEWATTQDQELLTQQAQKFNREYEAYDKDLMYGMDVISCLNKVLSNNEKVTKEGYVNGEKYDKSYAVEATMTIKKTLQESLIVYRSKSGQTREEESYNWDSGYTIDNVEALKNKLPEGSNFTTTTTKLQTATEDSDMTVDENNGKKYSLTYNWSGNDNENEGKLRAKLKTSDDLSFTVKNTKNLECKSNDDYIWTKVVYRSALYDLKTRKFTCTNVEYSSETGRICKIEFEEI